MRALKAVNAMCIDQAMNVMCTKQAMRAMCTKQARRAMCTKQAMNAMCTEQAMRAMCTKHYASLGYHKGHGDRVHRTSLEGRHENGARVAWPSPFGVMGGGRGVCIGMGWCSCPICARENESQRVGRASRPIWTRDTENESVALPSRLENKR
ncbi:hypothetical protein AMTR_s00098p00098950 [Amborella trichopoda]|uniref:Uncharacterized protein n=1 Tax=Amborella trichopoda TaxID=13333 RepID=W1NYS9_AMBTC|nr:hypothetical protein AMTR_s00098p00098950 [Amborella trichopoda]